MNNKFYHCMLITRNFECDNSHDVDKYLDQILRLIDNHDLITSLQVRNKNATIECIEKFIKNIKKHSNIHIIINDYIDLLEYSDGVHIGQSDCSISNAMEYFNNIKNFNKSIGVSVSNIDEFIKVSQFNENYKKLNKKSIDYIGLGPIYPTNNKDKPAMQMDHIKYIINNSNIPIVGIGGINGSNIEKIYNIGIRNIAAIESLHNYEDIHHISKVLL